LFGEDLFFRLTLKIIVLLCFGKVAFFFTEASGFRMNPMMGATMFGQAMMQGGPIAWSHGLFPMVPPEQFGAAMLPSPQAQMYANMMAAMMGGAASSSVIPPMAPPAENPRAKPKAKPKATAKAKAKNKAKAKAKAKSIPKRTAAPKKAVSKKKRLSLCKTTIGVFLRKKKGVWSGVECFWDGIVFFVVFGTGSCSGGLALLFFHEFLFQVIFQELVYSCFFPSMFLATSIFQETFALLSRDSVTINCPSCP